MLAGQRNQNALLLLFLFLALGLLRDLGRMEKLCFLVLLCLLGCALGADNKLLNSTLNPQPGAAPYWTRTSLTTQVPPMAYRNAFAFGAGYSDSNQYSPALYWGNSFTIKNVRPQNDTVPTRKRLTAQNHFAIQNQTIAMLGQEYLIRPRGYIEFGSNKKAFDVSQQSPNGIFFDPTFNMKAIQALNVTPQWAAFRLTNSSDVNSAAIAFFDSETLRSEGATFELWASNPSAGGWFGPGSAFFNVSDPNQARLDHVPHEKVIIEWLVACRWIANGTDCGDDAVPANDICQLVEDGLCWARFEPPVAQLMLPDGTTATFLTDQMDELRGDWSIAVATRPLTLWNPSSEFAFFFNDDVMSSLTCELPVDVRPGVDSPSFVVGLPLNDEPVSTFDARPFTPQGSTANDWLRKFMPGRDNSGGTLEITVRSVIELPDPAFSTQLSCEVSHIHMVPSTVVISKEQPTGSFFFTNITKPLGVAAYIVRFLVTEKSPSTITLGNSTAALGSIVGTYPNGAYSISTIILQLQSYDFKLMNFPAPSVGGVIQLPITPEALLDCSNSGNQYIAELENSPTSIQQEFVSFPFTISPPGSIKLWSCGVSSKGQNTPIEMTSFNFSGSNTVLVFYVTTQSDPVSGVILSFGTPVLSNSVLIDPAAGFTFAQNGTYSFSVTQNDVHLYITNDAGIPSDSYDETGGPFVNQDFYMQFTWTPASPKGFRISVTGLYTTFPSNAEMTNNNTTGTFTVPPGATGYLAGPFRASSPVNLDAADDEFDIFYSLTLLDLPSGSDATWYRLENALEVVTIARHRFAMLNAPEEVVLLLTGQKSTELCIAPAFIGALSLTDEVWLSVVPDEPSVIIEPVDPFTGAQPPTALRLTAASPVACFTARFDTNTQFLNYFSPLVDIDDRTVDVEVFLSGPSANSFQDQVQVANMPSFSFKHVSVYLDIALSPLTQIEDAYLAGESALVWISIESPPPNSIRYNVSLGGSSVTPVSDGAGQFTPTGPLQHLWQISFDVLPVSEFAADHSSQYPNHFWQSILAVILHGADAVYTIAPTSKTLTVVVREISFSTAGTQPVFIGYNTGPFVQVRLEHPVVNGLMVTPFAHNSGSAASGVSFTPASFSFTTTSEPVVDFYITGDMFGIYNFQLLLSGPDQSIFAAAGTTSVMSTEVKRREAPQIEGLFNMKAGKQKRWTLRFPQPVLPDEDVKVELNFGSDFRVSKSSFNGADGPTQDFEVTWIPNELARSSDGGDFKGTLFVSLSGADMWKYEPPANVNISTLALRSASLTMASVNSDAFTEGVRYTGYLHLQDGPAPEGFRIFLLAPSIQFYEPGATSPSSTATTPFVISFTGPQDGFVKYFEYVITSPLSDSPINDADPGETTILVTVILDDSFAGNRFFLPPRGTSLKVGHRKFNLVMRDPFNGVYMVNRQSQLFSVVLTSPSTSPLTMTISHPSLHFNGGQREATLLFAPGQLSTTFSFLPTKMLHTSIMTRLSVSVTGAEASKYTYADVWNKLSLIYILPELGFSPIPAIPTDRSVSGLKVWLVDALEQGFSYDSESQFALTISSEQKNVLFEPSILTFSTASLKNNRLSQEFSITHTSHTSEFSNRDTYSISWSLTLSDGTAFTISSFVPLDARTVILSRYQVRPQMPSKLNFGWQNAAVNLTRAPNAHLTLIPHGALEDGGGGPHYGGALTAGGRIVFDPATIVFAPGQQVANFMMKGLPGSHQHAVYYRVQWEMVGEEDDLENYLDYTYPRFDAKVTSHFATWHVASSAILQLSVAVGITLATMLILL